MLQTAKLYMGNCSVSKFVHTIVIIDRDHPSPLGIIGYLITNFKQPPLTTSIYVGIRAADTRIIVECRGLHK